MLWLWWTVVFLIFTNHISKNEKKGNAAFRPHSNACTFPYVWEIRFLIPNSHFLFFVMSGLTAMCSQRNDKTSSWSPIARDVQGRCPIGEGSSDIPRRMESDWLLTCVLCVYLPLFLRTQLPLRFGYGCDMWRFDHFSTRFVHFYTNWADVMQQYGITKLQLKWKI